MDLGKALQVNTTPIPGLLMLELPVHGDNRGWFKENWQREKMVAAGLPDFAPVQNNVSFNDAIGTTRGVHAEPWDKYISVAAGRVFAAWVDLRAGPTFGTVFTSELDPSRAVFVPRGVGNAFQTLEPETVYTYLLNAHFSPNAAYPAVNVADDALAIGWPIPLSNAVISDKDRVAPRLIDAEPIAPRKTLVIGTGGQVGRALRETYSDSTYVDFGSDIDLEAPDLETARPWNEYGAIINAAAYTDVDGAETLEGRTAAWAVNVTGVTALTRIATAHNITLVHISSDYVFDGTSNLPYQEDDLVCPLGVYGQTKAAGEQIVATVPRHYILRTSWVIGDGPNFVRTMLDLAERGISPSVVDDQIGRLTFASELAGAVRHLVDTHAPHGIYNVTCSGPPMSWADVATEVFRLCGHDPGSVSRVSTEAYSASQSGPTAPRPNNSTLDLGKIESTGFASKPVAAALADYVAANNR